MKEERKKKRPVWTWVFLGAYGVFIVVSLLVGFAPGRRSAESMLSFLGEMVLIIPAAFILIGLFEVWVPRSVVERRLGGRSGLVAHLWAFLLAGTTVGGLYVAFPVGHALYSKGARLGVVFSYIGLSGICRVPMTLFEISFLGVEFTLLRYAVGVPLVILFSDRLGRILERRGYRMREVGST